LSQQVNTNAGQVNANAQQDNANVGQHVLVAPAVPQQQRQDDAPRANRPRARDLLWEFERDELERYNSSQTNLGTALAALNHLEDSLMIRRFQANVRIAAAQIEERRPGYSRYAASSYSRSKSRSERPCQRRRSQGPLDPVAEEGRGENEVAQSVNPAASAATNAPANVVANTPANASVNDAGNIANNAANAVNVQGNAAPNP
jgi:hypothetical protein